MNKTLLALLILGIMVTDFNYFRSDKKDIKVSEAIEGIYTFWDNELLDNPNIIGYLALYSGNYYFTYLNYNDLGKSSNDIASKFCFIKVTSGKYKLKFRNKINESIPISQYEDNEILATINFEIEKRADIKANKTFLLRNDRDRKFVYFHSNKSELQLWNISKSWENDGISESEAIEIADIEAVSKLNEVNKSEFAKDFTYKFKVQDYNKKIGLCIVSNELYWYILYTYTFKYAAENEMHFAGHPAHFTVRINVKTKNIQFLYGE